MRFSNIFAALCSASAVTALALPQTMTVAVPIIVIPFVNYNGGGGILKDVGFLALDGEITKLNNTLTNFNAASLTSLTGGGGGVGGVLGNVLGGTKGLFGALGLGNTAGNTVTNTLNSAVATLLGPLLGGLSGSGGLMSAYANVLNQLNSLNARNIALDPSQAQLINEYLVQYQARLQQLMSLIQAKQADFAAISGGSLPTDVQGALTGLLGGANAGTSLDRVRSFLSQLNLNNDQLLGGSTSLVSRVAPTLQQALQSVTSAIQQLIRVTIQIYMV